MSKLFIYCNYSILFNDLQYCIGSRCRPKIIRSLICSQVLLWFSCLSVQWVLSMIFSIHAVHLFVFLSVRCAVTLVVYFISFHFKEFLFCILPMINIPRLRNTLLRLMWKKPDAMQDGKALLMCHCGVCGELPTNAHQTRCGHMFCYICIKVYHYES